VLNICVAIKTHREQEKPITLQYIFVLKIQNQRLITFEEPMQLKQLEKIKKIKDEK
jgi:hypothetical protein